MQILRLTDELQIAQRAADQGYEKVLREKDREIQALQGQLQQIEEYETTLLGKERELARLGNILVDRDREIARLQQQLRQAGGYEMALLEKVCRSCVLIIPGHGGSTHSFIGTPLPRHNSFLVTKGNLTNIL